jgi:hypothetical protein
MDLMQICAYSLGCETGVESVSVSIFVLREPDLAVVIHGLCKR